MGERQLEHTYVFDRLGDERLIQAYRLLVSERRRIVRPTRPPGSADPIGGVSREDRRDLRQGYDTLEGRFSAGSFASRPNGQETDNRADKQRRTNDVIAIATAELTTRRGLTPRTRRCASRCSRAAARRPASPDRRTRYAP